MVPADLDPDDFSYQYNWYDQDIVHTKTMDKNGKITPAGTLSRLKKVTTTNFDWEWKARANIWANNTFKPTKEKDHGGFVLTSSKGFVPGNDGGKYNAQGRGPSVNIDDILDAFDMAGAGGNIRIDKGAELSDALEYLSGVRSLVDKIPEGNDNKSHKEPKDTVCSGCEGSYHGLDMNVRDSDGKTIETIKSEDYGKIQK